MSETRLRFAGAEAVVGWWALAAFAGLATLGGAGLLVVGATSAADRGWALPAGAVGAAAGVGLGVWLGRGLRRFRTLVVGADGAWTLRDLLGRVRLRLGPEDLRAVDVRRDRAWFFTGVATRVSRAWVEVALPDGRVVASLRSSEAAARPTLERLAAIERAARGG